MVVKVCCRFEVCRYCQDVLYNAFDQYDFEDIALSSNIPMYVMEEVEACQLSL